MEWSPAAAKVNQRNQRGVIESWSENCYCCRNRERSGSPTLEGWFAMDHEWICPQCLMQWQENIGKCPCSSDSLRPAFVVQLDRFLASVNLGLLQRQFEDHYHFPAMRENVLRQFPQLVAIKRDRVELLKAKYGEIAEDY